MMLSISLSSIFFNLFWEKWNPLAGKWRNNGLSAAFRFIEFGWRRPNQRGEREKHTERSGSVFPKIGFPGETTPSARCWNQGLFLEAGRYRQGVLCTGCALGLFMGFAFLQFEPEAGPHWSPPQPPRFRPAREHPEL